MTIPFVTYPIRWHLILAMERVIKCCGLWMRYRHALGFYAYGPELNHIPLFRQIIGGVPYRRRMRALWCTVSRCERAHSISPPIHKDIS